MPPSYHLYSVQLERFKAAFKPKALYLTNFNILIGRNGSGKSTLLEALQWLDTTMRSDARAASDRYFGVQDLVNLRSTERWFRIALGLVPQGWNKDPKEIVNYEVRVDANNDGTPEITIENLWTGPSKRRNRFIKLDPASGKRVFCAPEQGPVVPFSEPDRLALSRGVAPLENSLRDFFRDWVFLRLSPGRLAKGSPARRRSFDPLLDEEGQNLPALLHELSAVQRKDLINRVQQVLPGMNDVRVDARKGRDANVNYSLMERMPYKGRAGKRDFPIPSWMLSEGTRRITALFALLVHNPPPSLLCIEEVENGLDPKTMMLLIDELKSAADHGTQILMTTHNPWLLDHVELEHVFEARRVDGNTVYERFSDRKEIQAYSHDVPPGTRYVSEIA